MLFGNGSLSSMLKKIKYKVKNIISGLPSNSQVYVFGSAVNKKDPPDIDILVIYDEKYCKPDDVYNLISPFFLILEDTLGYKTDLVFLTKEEEEKIEFVKNEGCLEI